MKTFNLATRKYPWCYVLCYISSCNENAQPHKILGGHLSKIHERLFFDQLSRHANKILSRLLCGFRKAYSMEHAPFRLLQP